MESFDTDAAKLAGMSSFDPGTLTVQTRYNDMDEQLEGVEAELGINQGWAVDMEGDSPHLVDVVGHREALAQTLRDQVEDIGDADHSGPSRRTDFSCSTGNSTHNSEGTVRQHTLRAKALQNIDLVDRNYTLENDLRDTQDRMSALLAQNALLQSQLASTSLPQVSSPSGSHDDEAMLDDTPMDIRGGGGENEDSSADSLSQGRHERFATSVASPMSFASSCGVSKRKSPPSIEFERRPVRLPTGEPITPFPTRGNSAPRKRVNTEEEKGPGGPCPWGTSFEDRRIRQAETRHLPGKQGVRSPRPPAIHSEVTGGNEQDGGGTASHFLHDQVAVDARFALGSWPDDDIRAVTDCLSRAEVGQRAEAALRASSSVLADHAMVASDESSASASVDQISVGLPTGSAQRPSAPEDSCQASPDIPTTITAS